jgi:ubiquinone/menaquinone biosynthesis C-methylase UbiE
MNDHDLKKDFKREFQEGSLYNQWRNIYDGDTFWSKWAAHRMEEVVNSIDRISVESSRDLAMDIGVGAGRILEALASRGFTTYGADFSIGMIQNCRELIAKKGKSRISGFIASDVENLPIRNDSLDLLTCMGVFEYLKNDQKGMSELFRVLKPGGHAILVVASYHRIGGILKMILKKLIRTGGSSATVPSSPDSLKEKVRMVNPLTLKEEARKGGFLIRKFKCFGGKVFGRYLPIRLFIPGILYVGDHCLLVLEKPGGIPPAGRKC